MMNRKPTATVGELIRALQKLPHDMPVLGYCDEFDYVNINPDFPVEAPVGDDLAASIGFVNNYDSRQW